MFRSCFEREFKLRRTPSITIQIVNLRPSFCKAFGSAWDLADSAGYLGNGGNGLKLLTDPPTRCACLLRGWLLAGHTQAKISAPRTTTPIHGDIFDFINALSKYHQFL
jgi:hypothetical protein